MSSYPFHLPAPKVAAPRPALLRLPRVVARATAAGVIVRRAVVADQAAIVALVRSERLNPRGLDWERFWVAAAEGVVIGAAQIRNHADGAREVGSVVVEPGHRNRGVASRLLDALLAEATDELYLVTRRALVRYYGRWGFEPTALGRVPRSVRANFWLGQLVGGATACLHGRLPRRLHVLRRPARGCRHPLA